MAKKFEKYTEVGDGIVVPVESSSVSGTTPVASVGDAAGCSGVNPFKTVYQSVPLRVGVAAIAGGAIVTVNGVPVFVPGAVVRDLGNGMASFQ